MNRILTAFSFVLLISTYSAAQICPGDVIILEDERLEVWDVATTGTQILSVAGFQNTVNVGGTDFTQTDTGLGEYGVLVMSHDISGAFQWAHQMTGKGFFTTKLALAANPDAVVVTATEIQGNDTIQNFRVESLGISNGVPVWTKSYPINVTTSNLPYGAQFKPYSAAFDGTGKLIIAGAFSGSADIGGTVLNTTAGFSESFVIALDETDGTDLWATQSTGSTGRGRAWTLEIDNSSNIIIGGHYTGTIAFGAQTFSAANSKINPYIARLSNVNGSAQWLVGMQNIAVEPEAFENIYDLAVDPLNNVYFAGNFNNNLDIQGTTITSAGGTDMLIGAVDSTGVLIWANQFGGPSTSDEFATSIVYSNSASALFIGGQLATSAPQYANINLDLPATGGHYVIGLMPDGSIEPIAANAISQESNFGYSATYIDATNTYISSSIIWDNGTNISVAQWIPNRPTPLAQISLQDGILNPAETLTAFDPGSSLYTFQWYYNGVIIPGEVNATYTAALNGRYSLEVFNSNGCSVFSDEILLLDGSTLESDSLALVDFYNKTNGAGWTNNTNWLTGNVDTWNGVLVNGGRVTEINLNSNNINGQFPSSLTQLSALQTLNLGGNILSGQLPSNLGDMTQLVVFAIWGNQMSGPIPSSIGNLTNLQAFYPSDNAFSGPLPTEIGNCTLLQGLAFSNNQITGPFPASIANLTQATYFEFINNPINDVLPTEIGSMTALNSIQMDNAQLIGSIPSSIGNLSGLEYLNVANNQLNGAIPAEIGNFSLLRDLNLGNNLIQGPIPASIGGLDSLRTINFYNNPINDVVPTELANLTKLENLNLSDCQLQGSFPEAIWSIPAITGINLTNNSSLEVVLPTTLNTQFVDIRLDQTLPKGGAFPDVFYTLPNLAGLSLGNKGYTGPLGAGVGNWKNLNNIYLWGNQLDGDFPSEILSDTTLQVLYLRGNLFTSIPDLSSLTNLIQVDVALNRLDFNSIVPNLDVAEFVYDPQGVRGVNDYSEVAEGGSIDLINDYTASGNVYQWVRNATDSISTSVDYNIASAKLSDLGGYFAWVTNPGAPDLTLRTKFYNIAFSGAPRSWTVDNDPESLADFKTLYAAIYGTKTGDTLYVAGSDTPYYESNMRLEQQRIIYGPGYFLGENPETQANTKEALAPFINIAKGSEGTEIYGMTWDQIYINNQSSAINDTVSSIHIVGNKIRNLGIVDDVKNILIDKNFIEKFELSSTPLLGVSRSYIDITVKNNIIDTLTSGLSFVNAAKNVMQNVVFDRNTVNIFPDSIADATVSNNIINNYQAVGNTESGTIGYTGASFLDNALLVDNDFVSSTSVDAGAFSGSDPYVLSGIPPAPHIFELLDAGRIRFNVKAKNENAEDIVFLNYKIGQGGTTVLKGTVKKLEIGNPVEVLFRPKVSTLTPGGTYNMMIWTKDANGVKSIHHNAIFTAETASAGGQIFTSASQPVTNGEVLLFEINQEQTAFDTLSTTVNSQGQFTFGNIVVGDYLALGKANLSQYPDQLPTYYLKTDLWEEADTLVIDTSSPTFNITLIEKPKEAVGVGVVAGTIEEELDQGNSGGRTEARGRVSGAGVSMRRGTRTGRGEEIVYELIEYVYTNENGEFFFENLPADNYRINIQYPGYPMDTLSNVDLTIENTKNNNYNLAALVDEGKISVTILSTTGVLKDLVRAVNVYPNPSVEQINIAFNKDFNIKGDVEIALISATGERVYHGRYSAEQINKAEQVAIPVEQYQNGSYLVQIKQQGKEIGTIRILVMK